MAEKTEVLFRPATPPEDPKVKWRGFAPGQTLLPAGSTYAAGGRLLTCDIILDRDVEVQLRDGTRIFVDVYRPVTDDSLPAVMAWSPYGKQGSYQEYDIWPARAGVARSAVSGLGKSEWEGPDPAFWCAHGYALVAVDPRGSFASEGDVQWMSPLEAQDGYDVVEWIAAQQWSAGSVVMAGNSWLAVMQWRIAATRPPHLSAIAPWEGFTDVYRDLLLFGGIPRLFPGEIITEMNAGRGRAEDVAAMARKYPFMNDYWRSKIIDVEAITVPAYVVASWTNVYHTRGTLDAFSRLDPSQSWLRVHNTLEWPDQYAYEEDLLRFFDHVIRGADNGWDQTPRVRLSVLDPAGQDVVNRPENEYPLARTRAIPLYLDAGTKTMSSSPLAEETAATVDVPEGEIIFDFAIECEVELVGPASLRLWIETDTYDADVFVHVRKADGDGNPLFATIPPGMPFQGAPGRLRATHSELDAKRSAPLTPVHTHERPIHIAPGVPFPLDIPIWPVGMAWHPGQRLQVVITGKDIDAFHPLDAITVNSGKLTIRTGGKYDSHLLVPVVSPDGV